MAAGFGDNTKIQFGYRYANTTEVAQLFTNGGMIFLNGGNFLVDYGAASFIANLVGITNNPGQNFFRAVGFAEQDPFSPTQVNAMYVPYGDSFMTGAAFTGNIHNKNAPSATIGNWLVRDAVVPEPETQAIFGIGIVGLGFARRRRTR